MNAVTQQITTFDESSGTDVIKVHNFADSIYKKTQTYYTPEIRSFLEMPQEVYTFNWTATDSGCVTNLSFPHQAFQIPTFWNKLKNFKYLRSGIRVSVRVNATPFHYGQLLVAAYPMSLDQDQNYHDGTLTTTFVYHQDPMVLSSTPHILLQPTNNRTATIELPWTLPQMYIDLEKIQTNSDTANQLFWENEIMHLKLVVVNPLRSVSGDPSPVEVTFFVNFVDPVLDGINSNVADYTNNPTTNFSVHDYRSTVLTEALTWTTPTAEEAELEAQGPIAERDNKDAQHSESSALNQVGDSFVKVLAPAAGAILAGAALADKPNTASQPQLVTIARNENTQHGEGLDNAPVLSIKSNARIERVPDSTPTTIRSITSIPGMILRDVAISSSSERVFLQFLIHPMNVQVYQHAYSTPLPNRFYDFLHTPTSFMSSLFGFWRGTLRYKIQFVCSSLQSARIRVSWNPLTSNIANNSEPYILSSLINKVIDIRGPTEEIIDIPYLSDVPYLPTWDGRINNSVPLSGNGHLVFSIVNKPTAGVSPAPDIFMNVWVSAGDDFQLMYPTTRFATKVTTNQNIYAPLPAPTNPTALEAQGPVVQSQDGPDEPVDMKERGLIPFSAFRFSNISFPESVESVYTLCKRYGYMEYSAPNSGKALVFYYNPYACQHTGGQDSASIKWRQNVQPFSRVLDCMYRFKRGSYNMRFVVPSSQFQFTPYFVPYQYCVNDMGTPGTLPSQEYSLAITERSTGDLSRIYSLATQGSHYWMPQSFDYGSVCANLPYCSNWMWYPTIYARGYKTSAWMNGMKGWGVYTSVNILESVGDDFQYLFFMGAPTISYAFDQLINNYPFYND